MRGVLARAASPSPSLEAASRDDMSAVAEDALGTVSKASNTEPEQTLETDTRCIVRAPPVTSMSRCPIRDLGREPARAS
jgi:hypothetical protein